MSKKADDHTGTHLFGFFKKQQQQQQQREKLCSILMHLLVKSTAFFC